MMWLGETLEKAEKKSDKNLWPSVSVPTERGRRNPRTFQEKKWEQQRKAREFKSSSWVID